MKSVVITGSTRGIGRGLAEAFLSRGCNVVLNSRDASRVKEAVAVLESAHGAGRVFGVPCDVRRFEELETLWELARQRLGRVDIWVNNAGVGQPQSAFWDLAPETIREIVDTNVIGALYGSRVALRGMLQQGSGALYNMEGLGSDFRRFVAGLSVYPVTKAGLRYFDDALARETESTPVITGAIRPGMVVTDLLIGQYKERPAEEWARARRVFNLLAEHVQTVAPWIAERVLENRTNGVRISWPTSRRAAGRLLLSPLRRRDLFG
jgi:NAD(P)-dependent dehydrogenase (short-subunit alcohol dehydrogenase family)